MEWPIWSEKGAEKMLKGKKEMKITGASEKQNKRKKAKTTTTNLPSTEIQYLKIPTIIILFLELN